MDIKHHDIFNLYFGVLAILPVLFLMQETMEEATESQKINIQYNQSKIKKQLEDAERIRKQIEDTNNNPDITLN